MRTRASRSASAYPDACSQTRAWSTASAARVGGESILLAERDLVIFLLFEDAIVDALVDVGLDRLGHDAREVVRRKRLGLPRLAVPVGRAGVGGLRRSARQVHAERLRLGDRDALV